MAIFLMLLILGGQYLQLMSSSRVSSSDIRFKLEIQINEKVKFGKITYQSDNLIAKVFHDLRRIRIIPDHVEEESVRYFDRNDKELNRTQEFSNCFDVSASNHLIKLRVSDPRIDMDDIAQRAEEYISSSKSKKERQKGQEEAESFVRRLKQIFNAIQQHKYGEATALCQSDDNQNIIKDYAEEHKYNSHLIRTYERIIEGVLEPRDITLKSLIQGLQFKDNAKERIDSWVNRINTAKKTTKEQLELLQEKEQRIMQDRRDFEEFQKSMDDRVRDYEKIIQNLQLENSTLESRYEQTLQKMKEMQGENGDLTHSHNFLKYFASSDLILNQLVLTPKHSHSLLRELKACLPNLLRLKMLYSHNRGTHSSYFHKVVDLQENVLLVAKTQQGRIFGGFTTLPFDPTKRKHSPPDILRDLRSFLFTLYRDELAFFPLKAGMDSVDHEEGYIIFGHEEICIDRFKWKVESLLVDHQQDYLHFSDPGKLRRYFLSDEEESSAELSGLEVYQLVTS